MVKEKNTSQEKSLKKPKVKIQGISPTKVLTQGLSKQHHALVKEGRTGYFNDEYEREIKWL